MSFATLHFEHTAGADALLRIFNDSGQVLDWSDDTFKAFASATTPQLVANSGSIAAVTTGVAGSGAFAVAGDVTALLHVGARILVSGSTGNDGVYTIRTGSSYSSPNTTINVEEAVSDATVDGTLAYGVLEHTTLAGSGRSGYAVDVDLSKLNSSGAVTRFIAKWYDDAAPDADSIAVSLALPLVVTFSQLSDEAVVGHAQVTVDSTTGNNAHVSLWLMWRGARVPITGASCSVTLYEAGGTVALFTLDETDKLGSDAINDDRFELVQANPGFTADTQVRVEGTITLAGVTFNVEDVAVIIG
jgi:hypothetical protein